MTQSYYIATPISPDNFAGTKARHDIEFLAEHRGMQRIVFLGQNTANRRLSKQIQLIWLGLRNWMHLDRLIKRNSVVLFQYPHYPMKSAVLARFMIRHIQQRKHARFVALVHDLNSVRKTFGKAANYSDMQFLRQFDYIVCHNESMLDYLAQKGFDSTRLVPLGVFDYLTDEAFAPTDLMKIPSINIAGNLNREKSAYVHELLSTRLPYHLYLYGIGLDLPISNTSVHYEGFALAEKLPGLLQGSFGLVWDGDSIDTCSGDYGVYLSINNPHKLSLYLCAGIPVILWSGAALANYVMKNELGFCVDSLREIDEKLNSLDRATYTQMREHAKREGVRLRSGYYFNQAMDFVENACSKDQ